MEFTSSNRLWFSHKLYGILPFFNIVGPVGVKYCMTIEKWVFCREDIVGNCLHKEIGRLLKNLSQNMNSKFAYLTNCGFLSFD